MNEPSAATVGVAAVAEVVRVMRAVSGAVPVTAPVDAVIVAVELLTENAIFDASMAGVRFGIITRPRSVAAC